jgi:hypothetical protein
MGGSVEAKELARAVEAAAARESAIYLLLRPNLVEDPLSGWTIELYWYDVSAATAAHDVFAVDDYAAVPADEAASQIVAGLIADAPSEALLAHCSTSPRNRLSSCRYTGACPARCSNLSW